MPSGRGEAEDSEQSRVYRPRKGAPVCEQESPEARGALPVGIKDMVPIILEEAEAREQYAITKDRDGKSEDGPGPLDQSQVPGCSSVAPWSGHCEGLYRMEANPSGTPRPQAYLRDSAQKDVLLYIYS